MSETAWVLLGVGCLFSMVGGVFVAVWGIQRKRAVRSQSWPTVPGRVTSCEVRERTDTDDEGQSSTYYQAQITYEYEVDGETCKGKRIDFGDLWTNDRGGQETIASRYRTGSTVTVHYRPGHPHDAVLETTVSRGLVLFLVLGAIFDVLGVGLIIGAIIAR